MKLKRIGCVGLMALLSVACFVQAETLKIVGPSKSFDISVDITQGYWQPDSTLWLREYWNNGWCGYGGYDCRPFIRFDLSDIPEGVTIDSVSINFMVIYADNATPYFADLWQVYPFTNDMTAQTYDGVNLWPTVDPEFGVSYFDGIDGYNYKDPYTWEFDPADKHLAESDIAIDWDMSDQWIGFAGNDLTSYIQTQSDMALGSRFAYLQMSIRNEEDQWVELYSNECGDINMMPYIEVTYSEATAIPGDANNDGMVDVGDLGILAANYGMASGATWELGDFNEDGAVDVGDLGILAANYGTGTSGANWDADYAKVFGETVEDASADDTSSTICSTLGLPLIAGLALMGLMLVKLEE